MISSRKETFSPQRETDKMNRLPPRDLNGLLKFCIERTRSEDAPGNSVRPEDISPGMPDTHDFKLRADWWYL